MKTQRRRASVFNHQPTEMNLLSLSARIDSYDEQIPIHVDRDVISKNRTSPGLRPDENRKD